MGRSIRRVPLTEQATEALLRVISDTGLRSGDSLPPTGALAETLEVSVPVVREAMAGLAAIGVLRRQQGREGVVSTPGASHLGRVLEFRIANAEVDALAVQQYRDVVEVGSARLAAENRTAEGVDLLEAALAELRTAVTDDELHEADVRFHSAVATVGGNDLFILTFAAMEPLLRRLRDTVWSGWIATGGDRESVIDAHVAILDRIRAGDPDGAARAMRVNLAQARHCLEVAPGTAGAPAEQGS